MTQSKTSLHQDAEDRMRELLRNGGLAQPDEVTYEFDPDEVVFFWRDSKLAVIVELDEEYEREPEAPVSGEAEAPVSGEAEAQVSGEPEAPVSGGAEAQVSGAAEARVSGERLAGARRD